jgi:lysophospholipase L1-like esterase
MKFLPCGPSLILMTFAYTALFSACATTGVTPMTAEPLTIVAFGDSTTAHRDVDGAALRVYADILQESLPQCGIPVSVLNAGVGGNDTNQARGRFETDVLAHDPDLVVIQFGLNDSCIDVWDGKDKPRLTREAYIENLRYFVETLRARGCDVILMTPNPMRWTDPLLKLYGKGPFDVNDPWGFNLTNREYAQGVRDVAKELKVPLVDVYRNFHSYDGVGGKSTDDLLLDGMHPNHVGHALIADWLMAEIKQLR